MVPRLCGASPRINTGDLGVNTQAIAIGRQHMAQMRLIWISALAFVLVLAQALVAQARPDSFADLAEKISPAVVNITTSTVVAGRTGPQGIVPEGSPFEDFFN